MLNILYGRAGAGKTSQIMNDIKRRMSEGETGMLLIVPEQYSHDAERQLCDVCGDELSLHAEVLTFTRLCRNVFAETGGAAGGILDKSGQLLVMHKALEAVEPNLKVFAIRKTRTQMLESMLGVVREFKSMCVTSDMLEDMAQQMSGALSDKLRDFALVFEAYEALQEKYGGDSAQRLNLLAEKIADSTVGSTGHIYFDGFSDFTAQELRIIEKILLKGADVTVCLTCELAEAGTDAGYDEVFEIPRRTIGQLKKIPVKITYTHADNSGQMSVPELAYLEKHLFSYNPSRFTNETETKEHPVNIYAAPSKYTECEYAAATIWSLVRSGYRWRDIAVMARDFEQYEPVCEHVFERYGIPYFTSGKADIQNKPPIALLDAALSIATAGWEYDSVGRYLKTGLLELSIDEIATLENYILMWNIRGNMWLREWTMPPSGYETGFMSDTQKKKDAQTLKSLNEMREKITKPLIRLRDGLKPENKTDDNTVYETETQAKLRALYDFITDISLPQQLANKSKNFEKRGMLRQAREYTQLFSIIIDAIDQMYVVLGASRISAAEFRKMLALVLSAHDVGVIPIALDRVPLGSMTMSRRRNLKCLIILGATDDNMPKLTQSPGILSDNERKTLSQQFDDIPSGFEERMYREMNMIYQTLTLPNDKLYIIYDTSSSNRPSYLSGRLCEMFSLQVTSLTEEEYLGASKETYEELLCMTDLSGGVRREPLTAETAKVLYGDRMSLSATQLDEYYSCPYKHFLQRGLRLNARKKAEFDALSAGSFMHHILEGVFSELAAKSRLYDADEGMLEAIASKYADKYINDVLLNFEGKNPRFEYLFRRYEKSLKYVLIDMVDELKCSKFTPAEFEMNLSKLLEPQDFPQGIAQRGFIDRVDKCEIGDELYLRVIDYKTRKSAYEFDICDIYHGRDMQMLIYLFALCKYGEKKFGKPPRPAGVLYMPARDVVISAARNQTDEQIDKLRQRQMKRSGLIYNDLRIIDAMESGETKKYLPVKKSKDGNIEGDSLVDMHQINALSKHVDDKISRAKSDILSGYNECMPYYKKSDDNACTYCRYFAVCGFDEQEGDKHLYAGKMSKEEAWERIINGE